VFDEATISIQGEALVTTESQNQNVFNLLLKAIKLLFPFCPFSIFISTSLKRDKTFQSTKHIYVQKCYLE
jgi:hypothetical protein